MDAITVDGFQHGQEKGGAANAPPLVVKYFHKGGSGRFVFWFQVFL